MRSATRSPWLRPVMAVSAVLACRTTPSASTTAIPMVAWRNAAWNWSWARRREAAVRRVRVAPIAAAPLKSRHSTTMSSAPWR